VGGGGYGAKKAARVFGERLDGWGSGAAADHYRGGNIYDGQASTVLG
jgi:hypothetical protein